MDPYEEALKESREGTVIAIDVSCGAREAVFPSGYNPWRKSICMAVREPPTGGKANAAIVKQLSHFFSLPPSAVRIVSGASSHHKAVLLSGVSRENVIAALRQKGTA
ncbi:MAG: DUF167 domain-containing protein [Methanolinea sp.]|nr:DUF167 domain-containing protein [Methanolinea sp.]